MKWEDAPDPPVPTPVTPSPSLGIPPGDKSLEQQCHGLVLKSLKKLPPKNPKKQTLGLKWVLFKALPGPPAWEGERELCQVFPLPRIELNRD